MYIFWRHAIDRALHHIKEISFGIIDNLVEEGTNDLKLDNVLSEKNSVNAKLVSAISQDCHVSIIFSRPYKDKYKHADPEVEWEHYWKMHITPVRI